jgi:hypothetical protein
MIGIPLMFMCLTYTGDLLADAFISGYSKMVNFFYRQVCRGPFRKYLPDSARRSFEQPDVRKTSSIIKFRVLYCCCCFFFVDLV